LKEKYESVDNPSGLGGATTSRGRASECPPQTSLWRATCSLPDRPAAADEYYENGAGEPLGIDGPTNMWDGGPAPNPSTTGPSSAEGTKNSSESSNIATPLSIPSVNMMTLAAFGWFVFAGVFGGLALL